MKTLLIGLFACALSAQTLDLKSTRCQAGASGPKIAALVPVQATVAGKTVTLSVPVCLSVGANLVVNMAAAGGPALEGAAVSQPGTVNAPKMASETITLDPAMPDTQTTLAYSLQKNPAPNTLLLIFFTSSRVGGDLVDVRPAVKDLSIALPAYRPFSGDKAVVVYWTLE